MDGKDLKYSIVRILSSEEAEEAEGTGFWAGKGGYLLTCYHVIKDLKQPWVEYNQTKATAKFIKNEGDIALLKVDKFSGENVQLDTEYKHGDSINSLGYQYERLSEITYFPLNGSVIGPTEIGEMPAITLENAIDVKPKASGAPALNLRTGKVIGIISDIWKKREVAFVLSLDPVIKKWEPIRPRFHIVDYRQKDIFDHYNPFVGRDEDIKGIQKFLRSEAGKYLLIHGTTGIGKTAFVTELARRGAKGELSDYIYCLVFFIRQEGGHNTPVKFLNSLNRQLIQLLSKKEDVPSSLADKERQYEELWREVETQVWAKNRILIIIDGLDESDSRLERKLQSDFLPSNEFHKYKYFIITSRPLPDFRSAFPSTHFIQKAELRKISGLNKINEVRDLLSKFEDQVQRTDEFIEQLINRTNGEPIYLRFLCKDIAGTDEKKAEMLLERTPEDVRKYFQVQFNHLKERSDEANNPKISLDILKVLLVARGGMTAEELSGVLKKPLLNVNDSLELIERYLIGKESRELMHQEFRKTIEEKLVRQEEKEQVLKKLMDYCAVQWCKDHPNEEYALKHYLQHLWELEQYNDLLNICNKGYLDKKLEILDPSEFLEQDYLAVFETCRELDDLDSMLKWGAHRARIFDELIAFRDIKTIPEVVGKLLLMGKDKWWHRGIGICSLIPEITGKIETLLRLGEGLELDKCDAPNEVFDRVWEFLKDIPLGIKKYEFELKFITELCRWNHEQIERALKIAIQIEDAGICAKALGKVAHAYGGLSEPDKAIKGLEQLIKVAEDKIEAKFLAKVRIEVALAYGGGLSDSDKAAVILTQALRDEFLIEHAEVRAKAQVDVAMAYVKLSDPNKAAEVLGQALKTAKKINMNESYFTKFLTEVALVYGELSDPGIAAKGLNQLIIESEDNIHGTYQRASALIRILRGYQGQTNIDKTSKILMQVVKYLTKANRDSNSMIDTWAFLMALNEVARAFGKLTEPRIAAEVLEQALETAKKINTYESYFAVVLTEITHGYRELSDPDKTAKGLEQIVQVADTIKNEVYLAEILAEVVQAYMGLSDLNKAKKGIEQIIEVADKIKNRQFRAETIVEVARAYGGLSNPNKADQVLKNTTQIEYFSREQRIHSLTKVAKVYEELSYHDKAAEVLAQALEVSDQLKYGEDRVRLLTEIGRVLGHQIDEEKMVTGLVQLIKKADETNYSGHRAEALVKIARAHAELSYPDKATEILAQALIVGEQIPSKWDRETLITEVARTYKEVSDSDKIAKGLLQLIRIINQTTELIDPSDQLIAVIRSYGEMSDSNKAEKGLEEIIEIADKMQLWFYWPDILTEVARTYEKLSDSDKAVEVLEQVLKAVDKYEKIRDPVKTLTETARVYVEMGDSYKAINGLKRIIESTNKIEAPNLRASILIEVARAYEELSDFDKATEVLEQALEALDQIKEMKFNTDILVEMARLCGILSKSDKAVKGLKIVMDRTRKIKKVDSRSRAEIFIDVAKAYVRRLDSDNAVKTLEWALKALDQFGEMNLCFEELVEIARICGKLSNAQKAAEILDRVAEATDKIKYRDLSAEIYIEIAKSYGELFDHHKAKEILEHALKEATHIVDIDENIDTHIKIVQGYVELSSPDVAIKLLERVISDIYQISDARFRSKMLAKVSSVASQIIKVSDVIELLSNITAGESFLNAWKNILNSFENPSISDNFLKDAFYEVLPLASKHSRLVYLKVVQEALPYITKHFSRKESGSILAFLEEQWEVK